MLRAITRRFAAATVLCALVGSGAALAQSSATRSSSFAYDPASGLPTQEVIEPDTSALRLETDYTYDAFGNKLSTTMSGIDIATRASSTTYSASGQFVSTNTNALGQSESLQYDSRFGTPTSQTGPNGLTTTRSYDSFGRKIQEIRPDGTQTKWTYQFCNGVNGGTATCVSGASYVVQATSYASDGATVNGSVVIVYFDQLDREVASDTQGFDGSTIRKTTTYDALGRVVQISRPYFVSGGTPQYTTFTYDALGRVLTQTKPDGGVSQTAYHGLTISKTNALNQTRSVTKDSQGNVVSVTDALGNTMTYAYDGFGDLVQTTDTVGNVVTASYDVRGNKIGSSDPDLGSWSYAYNTLGLLVSQTDAKNQVVSLTYDKLDRLVQAVEPDMTSVWVYDTAPNGVGKLISSRITAGPGSGFARSTSYDSLGRPTQVATMIDGISYTMGATYDANGSLSRVSYPSGFIARYGHTNLGDTNQLLDDATGHVYWTANTGDAELHLTQETAGNGLVTTSGFDPLTGGLISVATGTGATVQNLSFTYDKRGNLLSRTDASANLSESFGYDKLNRLTSSNVNLSPTPLSKTFSYDAIGNLTSKSDVGTYTYPAAGSPQPHAVMGIGGGSISTTFAYDSNGNQISGLGRSIVYTSYNEPSSITQGTRTISFLDDTEHQRFKQITPEGTTLYVSAFGVLAELSDPGTTSARWTDYLTVGDAMVGMRLLQTTSETLATRYFHTDHLGSISVITDENGIVVERLSYDAWGKRRFPNGTDDPTGSITSQTTRGFTGEEELSVSGLVHLNGRVYDPLLARMTSADPTVPHPISTQGWNRYAYVSNGPLRFTDPTGFDQCGDDGLCIYDIPPLPQQLTQMPVGGCYCNNTLGTVYPTPLPSPTVFSQIDALQQMANLNATIAAQTAALNAMQAQMQAMTSAAMLQAQQAAAVSILPPPSLMPPPATQVGYNGIPQAAPPSSPPAPFTQLGNTILDALHPNSGILGAGPGGGMGWVPGAQELEAGEILVLGAASAGARLLGRIPSRANTSRINIVNEAWGHVVQRHFGGAGSPFTITQNEVQSLLRSREVVGSPIVRKLPNADAPGGLSYLREVDTGRVIGQDKLTGKDTSILSVITDIRGNLQSTFPGRLPPQP
jgi:RHS repeat-associated protein